MQVVGCNVHAMHAAMNQQRKVDTRCMRKQPTNTLCVFHARKVVGALLTEWLRSRNMFPRNIVGTVEFWQKEKLCCSQTLQVCFTFKQFMLLERQSKSCCHSGSSLREDTRWLSVRLRLSTPCHLSPVATSDHRASSKAVANVVDVEALVRMSASMVCVGTQ